MKLLSRSFIAPDAAEPFQLMPIAEIQSAFIIAISATFFLRLSLVSIGFMPRNDERHRLLATHALPLCDS